MSSPRIIEQSDVLMDRGPGAAAGWPRISVNQLLLERGEETLSNSVIPAVPLPAHTADNPMLGQNVSIHPARILAAAIRVMDQDFPIRQTLADGHLQGIQHQFQTHMLSQRPAHYSSGKQINDHRQYSQPSQVQT